MKRGRFDDESEYRAPESAYFAERRHFARIIYLSIGVVVALCVGAFGLLVNRFDPCRGIDWIVDLPEMTELDPDRVTPFWPSREEFDALKRQSLTELSAGGQKFEALTLKGIEDNCLVMDWSAMRAGAGLSRNDFVKAAIRPPTSERLDTVTLTPEARRIAVRSALLARECRTAELTTAEPVGVLLVKELDETYAREQLVEATRAQFKPGSAVAMNSEIYLVSLLSPRNYFDSSNTLRFLTRVGAQAYLHTLYFDNTRDNVKSYGRGTIVYTEIIDLAPVRERIARAHQRCTDSGDRRDDGAGISVL
ncbi:MAG: hypothetical protein AAF317_17960 [Pseudomonadota bacterium]